MEEWYFDEDDTCWRDVPTGAICFDGYVDGERFVFAVSQKALNDYYETKDTPEEAENNYLNRHEHVESVAAQFASEYAPNEEPPHYFIDSEAFKELA